MIAGSLIVCRLAVICQTGALVATRRAQGARSLGHDVSTGRGRSPGRHLLGTTRRAQDACSLGERGRTPPGTARRALSARSPEECRLGGRSEPDRHVVVSGPSQLPGPGGPAESAYGRPAGQSAGRVPGPGHRAASPLRQAWGTDLLGTGEPGRSVAGLGPLLGARPAPGEPDGRRRRASPERGLPRRLAGPGPSPLYDSAISEQVPPGPCTDGFIAHRPGGPVHPVPCITCTLLHLDQNSIHAARPIPCLCFAL